MSRDKSNTSETRRLALLFGAFYFVQGVCEPTEGLIAQPMRSLLRGWGQDAAYVSACAALLALPWSVKPLYGLLSDFVPIFGSRRKSYLVLSSALAAAALIALYMLPLDRNSVNLLMGLLFVPAIGVAFCDVVVDALMVEKGQKRGITGQLQSVQWGTIWGASILTGYLGGAFSQAGRQELGFLVCGLVLVVTLFGTLLFVQDEPPRERKRPESRALKESLTSPAVLSVAEFIFLWSFNPFTSTVLYFYMLNELGMDEQFYGETLSWLAGASMVASFAYGLYCRRVSMRVLLHAAIFLGVLSTAFYFLLEDRFSARLITVAVGLTYATATMIQFDLAARICPPLVAGTLFALLMSVSNLAVSLSTWLGGSLYESWSAKWDPRNAFLLLVAVGAATTACCWCLVPILEKAAREPAAKDPS